MGGNWEKRTGIFLCLLMILAGSSSLFAEESIEIGGDAGMEYYMEVENTDCYTSAGEHVWHGGYTYPVFSGEHSDFLNSVIEEAFPEFQSERRDTLERIQRMNGNGEATTYTALNGNYGYEEFSISVKEGEEENLLLYEHDFHGPGTRSHYPEIYGAVEIDMTGETYHEMSKSELYDYCLDEDVSKSIEYYGAVSGERVKVREVSDTIYQFPEDLQGCITAGKLDLDGDGLNEMLTLRISPEHEIIAELHKVYGLDAKPSPVSVTGSAVIDTLSYTSQKMYSVFYSPLYGKYCILVDSFSEAYRTGVITREARIYFLENDGYDSIQLEGIYSWNSAETPNTDIEGALSRLGAPYARNCTRMDNVAEGSFFMPLCSINYAFSGDVREWEEYLGTSEFVRITKLDRDNYKEDVLMIINPGDEPEGLPEENEDSAAASSSQESTAANGTYDTYGKAYGRVLNEYYTACALEYQDYLNNEETYKEKFPHVNHSVLKEYLNPVHIVEGGWDEPYELLSMLYDVDGSGSPELIIIGGCHQAFLVDLFTYDGIQPLRVFAPDDMTAQTEDGSWLNLMIFDSGIIQKSMYNSDLGMSRSVYYRLAEDGYSLAFVGTEDIPTGENILYSDGGGYNKWDLVAEDKS